MKQLKEHFRMSGEREFTQLHNDERITIFQVRQPKADGDGHIVWYEVFKHRTSKPDQYHPNEYQVYPKDNDFGRWAWCCSNIPCLRKAITDHWQDLDADQLLEGLDFGLC